MSFSAFLVRLLTDVFLVCESVNRCVFVVFVVCESVRFFCCCVCIREYVSIVVVVFVVCESVNRCF